METDSLINLIGCDEKKDGVHESLLRLIYIKNIPLPNEAYDDRVIYREPPFASSSSINEAKLLELTKTGSPVAALNTYAKRHLIRVYPSGGMCNDS